MTLAVQLQWRSISSKAKANGKVSRMTKASQRASRASTRANQRVSLTRARADPTARAPVTVSKDLRKVSLGPRLMQIHVHIAESMGIGRETA